MLSKENLKIRFKFNDAMSEEECDEIFFKIFDIIFNSSNEAEETPISKNSNL